MTVLGILTVFGIYLPSDNIIQSYSMELNLPEELVAHFSSLGDVVIGGDLTLAYTLYDGDAHHANVYKSRLFKDFAMRNHIGCSCVDFDISGSDYTFILTQTTLDYILCSYSLCSYVTIFHVYE